MNIVSLKKWAAANLSVEEINTLVERMDACNESDEKLNV